MIPRLRSPIVLLLFASGSLSAQERYLHYGAKAAAMGGAFTAVADDVTAFYWNPAGYSFGPAFQAGVPWGESDMSRGDGTTFADEASGFAVGLTFMGVAATFSKSSSSIRDGDLLASRGLETFDLSVSILQSLPIDDLVIAANVHYLRGETRELVEPFAGANLDPSSIRDRLFETAGETSATASLDLAALYAPNEWLRLGVMASRLFEPSFDTASIEEVVLPRHARAGAAFELPKGALLSFDVDLTEQGSAAESWRELSLGAEKRLFEDALSLRAGVRAEAGSGRGARPSYSAGVGVRVRFLLIEAAYVNAPDDRDQALWWAVTVSP